MRVVATPGCVGCAEAQRVIEAQRRELQRLAAVVAGVRVDAERLAGVAEDPVVLGLAESLWRRTA